MSHRGLCIVFCLVVSAELLFSQSNPAADLKFDIKAVDPAADPCSDFYRYACGGWLARNPIPADRTTSAVYQQMRDLSQKRVTEILEQAAQRGRDTQPNKQSKDE